ncbi:MAG: chromosomal replication initiator protein DnaA [Selenomonadales bacterium]|nr:chromosomal replication initiator protein DnaA [Selenomonadales bacterium]
MEMSITSPELWQAALDLMQTHLGKHQFDTWLLPCKAVSLQGQTMYILAATEFNRNWLENNYTGIVQKALSTVAGRDLDIKFVSNKDDIPTIQPVAERGQDDSALGLNPRYVFDSFVIGESNRFAHAAALAVAEAPGRAYNPLFIYGGVGLGKTHLMHAIGHFALSRFPKKRVLYLSCEKFTNDFIASIQQRKTTEFRARYRSIDLLLIDDIQFLAGKEQTQEEFFHTFNALHGANKQIIISSDRPPKEIATLEDRLRSRFEWGLITDIQPPDLETRVAILCQKAEQENFRVPLELMAYIAARIHSNIRELEGALIRIMAYVAFSKRQVTKELIDEVLKGLFPQEKQRAVTVDDIKKAVATHYGLKLDDLTAKKRTRLVTHPRQVAMYLCRKLTSASLPRIGEEFGGRDHTTVIHACERVETDIARDAGLAKIIKEIEQKLLTQS